MKQTTRPYLSPVRCSSSLCSQPCPIQYLHNILRQQTLLKFLQVSLKLLKVAHADDNTVVPSLGFGV